MQYNDLINMLRENDLKHDPWGTVMGALFAVAAELQARRERIPQHWEYRAGSADPRDAEGPWYHALREAQACTLRTFGNRLERYARWLRRARRAY